MAKEDSTRDASAAFSVDASALVGATTEELVAELLRRPAVFSLDVLNDGRGEVGIAGPATCIVVLD
jgi:hypothetical protein